MKNYVSMLMLSVTMFACGMRHVTEEEYGKQVRARLDREQNEKFNAKIELFLDKAVQELNARKAERERGEKRAKL